VWLTVARVVLEIGSPGWGVEEDVLPHLPKKEQVLVIVILEGVARPAVTNRSKVDGV